MCWCLAPSCVDDVSYSYLIIVSEKKKQTTFQCFLMQAKWQVRVVLLHVQTTATVLENKINSSGDKDPPTTIVFLLDFYFC